MELGKVPPHDIEAEQAVIGSMLTDSDAVVEAIEVLKSDDFYRQDNKTIYEAIADKDYKQEFEIEPVYHWFSMPNAEDFVKKQLEEKASEKNN